MNRNIEWTKSAYKELQEWSKSDKTTVKKIINLLEDIDKNHPASGLGKPEQLKFNNLWSRRINSKDRLVYSVSDKCILIYQCKGHYQDK